MLLDELLERELGLTDRRRRVLAAIDIGFGWQNEHGHTLDALVERWPRTTLDEVPLRLRFFEQRLKKRRAEKARKGRKRSAHKMQRGARRRAYTR